MTPDLVTEIRLDELTPERARAISDATENLIDGFRVHYDVAGLFRRRPFLAIPDLHEYLAESADWDAATWDFEPEGRARLARTLECLYDLIPEPFRFSAVWIGDDSDELEVGRSELLTVVDGDAVGTHTTYLVSGADQERLRR